MEVFSTSTVIISILTAVVYILWTFIKTPKNLPPGPKGLPFVGFLPFMGKQPHITLTKLCKKYGDLFTFFIGSDRIILLSSFKLIKEVLHSQGEVFQDRPDSFRELVNVHSLSGIFGANGDQWIQLRRFVLTTLRNFGMGKASLEPKIQDEIFYLVEEIKKLKGQPTDIHELLTMSITNNICTIMYGRRLEYDDKHFLQMLHLSKAFVDRVGIDQWTAYVPQFIVKMFGYEHPVENGKRLYNYLDEYNKNYVQDDTGRPENFIEAWRTEAAKSTSNPKYFNERQLSKVLFELFIAGSDTTSITLEWGLLYLIKYADAQKKVQKEIDDVIGKNRSPTMSDMKLMPYTEAVIMEVHRVASIAPLDDPHCATRDTVVNGYFIPKGTHVYSNIWAVHHDPSLYPEPFKFKPERFLNEENKVKRVEELIPFSIGKRQCAGEAMARMELFLYLVNLLQHFTFTKEGEVDLGTHYAAALEPTHQKICAIPR